jgi:3-oxoacyl-[acyl-carrier protein] reductase
VSAPGAGHTLAGSVAIVTGAAGGIGQAACRALAGAGAAVVVVDRNAAGVEATTSALAACGGAATLDVVADVRSPEAMATMTQRTLEAFGRIDVLVAAAGVLHGRGRGPRPLAQVTTEEWDEVLGVNLRGTFLSNRAVLPTMVRQRRGQIVNISSTSGRRARAFDSVYCASKFAVIGLSESVAEEVRPFGVRVHVLLPDAVRTPLWAQNGPVPCPANALDPARVADFIVALLQLPDDTEVPSPVIAPARKASR